MHRKIEYYVTRELSAAPESSANQNRVLRNPSRQPIRIEYYVTRVEYYVTRELSARGEDPSRLESARYSLSQYTRVLRSPYLISSHSYYYHALLRMSKLREHCSTFISKIFSVDRFYTFSSFNFFSQMCFSTFGHHE